MTAGGMRSRMNAGGMRRRLMIDRRWVLLGRTLLCRHRLGHHDLLLLGCGFLGLLRCRVTRPGIGGATHSRLPTGGRSFFRRRLGRGCAGSSYGLGRRFLSGLGQRLNVLVRPRG